MNQQMRSPENGAPLERRVSRRSLLAGAVGILGLYAVARGSEAPPAARALARGDYAVRLPAFADQAITLANYEPLPTSRLRALFEQLTAARADAPSRVEAIKKSLRLVRNIESGAIGTALELDESGVYLTARHCLAEPNRPNQRSPYPIVIQDPYSGERHLAQNFLLHPAADLALVHAPNGRPARPTADLQLSLNEIGQAEGLWMISLRPVVAEGQPTLFYRYQSSGTADTSRVYSDSLGGDPSRLQVVAAAQLAVAGLTPLGGTSGGPIVDAAGVVRAVESGAYPAGALRAADYQGATVVPLAEAGVLLHA